MWLGFFYLISVCFNLQTIAYLLLSHLGPPRRRTTAEEDEKDKHPQPEVRSGLKIIPILFCLLMNNTY